MTWRGYLALSVVTGLLVGYLFAHTSLIIAIPLFCILFAVAGAIIEIADEQSPVAYIQRAVEKRQSRLAHNQEVLGSTPSGAISREGRP